MLKVLRVLTRCFGSLGIPFLLLTAAGCAVAPVRVTVPSSGVADGGAEDDPRAGARGHGAGRARGRARGLRRDDGAVGGASRRQRRARSPSGSSRSRRSSPGPMRCRIAGGTRRTASTSAPRRTASSTSPRGCARRAGPPVVRDAVQRTAGELLWFADGPARAVFHADCGGHTSNAAAVWGGVAPAYLSGANDKGPAGTAHADWTFETRAAALRSALNADPRTAVGARLDRIEIAGRDAGRPRREDPAPRHADVRRPRRGVPRGASRARSASRRSAARSSPSRSPAADVRVFRKRLRPRRWPVPGRRARAAAGRRLARGSARALFPGHVAAPVDLRLKAEATYQLDLSPGLSCAPPHDVIA